MPDVARTGRFYENLEALRGVAALMVALFHVGQFYYFAADGTRHDLIHTRFDASSTLSDAVFRSIGNGAGAVVIFFVLSGFVLTLALKKERYGVIENSTHFLAGRLFRIYPAIVSTIVLFTVFYYITGLTLSSPDQFSPWSIFLNFTLLRTSIDPVMWSMQLEMIAAPMLLLSFIAWRYGHPYFLSIILMITVCLAFTGWWMHFLPYFGQMHAFLFGMVACLYARPLIQRVSRPKLTLTLAVATFSLSRPFIGQGSVWAILLEAVLGAFIVGLLAFGPLRSFGIPGRLLRFYGRISFSFYLLHALVLTLWPLAPPYLGQIVNSGLPSVIIAIFIFLVSTLIITPLAVLQHQFVEIPGIALGRSLLNKSSKIEGRLTQGL